MGKNTKGEENNFIIVLLLHRGKIELYKNPTQQIDFRKWLWGFRGKNNLYKPQKRESSLPTNSKDVYGITGAKMTSINSHNENIPCPLLNNTKMDFLGLQDEEMSKTMKVKKLSSF